jgi:hypothetical protein
MTNASNITAPTLFIQTKGLAYRSCVFSTLPEPWTIGTQLYPIRLLWDAR